MSSIIFEEIPCRSLKIGKITLNNPKALNSLSLEMFQSLQPKLREWAQSPEIALVVIQSDLEKAFCAGGEVKNLAQKIIENPQTDFPEEFFRWEYKTDLLIHTFPKPVLAWLHGITMGGGIGLTNGASHRVVTETTTMAMPEISIGLFPDVGGGYFLSRLPKLMGLFLGWTGGRFTGQDALHLKLADHYIKSDKKQGVFQALTQIEWKPASNENKLLLTQVLEQFLDPKPDSHLRNLEEPIYQRLRDLDKNSAYDSLLKWTPADPWLQDTLLNFKRGSPLSHHLIYDHLEKCEKLSLKEVFVREWSLAVRVTKSGDFAEGVRAVLIDKDYHPHWRYPKFVCVPEMDVNGFFLPWPGYKDVERFFSD